MKKLISLIGLAVVTLALATTGAHAGTALGASYFQAARALQVTRTLTLTPGTTLPTWLDTVTVLTQADTLRTTNISTGDWDFSSTYGAGTTASAPHAIAEILAVNQSPYPFVSQSGADSLYFTQEVSYDGGVTYIQNNGFTSGLNAIGAAAMGNCLSLISGPVIPLTGSAGGCVLMGHIILDNDTPGLSNVLGKRDFRLKIWGDAANAPLGPWRFYILPLTQRTSTQ